LLGLVLVVSTVVAFLFPLLLLAIMHRVYFPLEEQLLLRALGECLEYKRQARPWFRPMGVEVPQPALRRIRCAVRPPIAMAFF